MCGAARQRLLVGRESLGTGKNKQVSASIVKFQPCVKSFLRKGSVLQVAFQKFLVNEWGKKEAEGPELRGCADESSAGDAGEDEFDPWL